MEKGSSWKSHLFLHSLYQLWVQPFKYRHEVMNTPANPGVCLVEVPYKQVLDETRKECGTARKGEIILGPNIQYANSGSKVCVFGQYTILCLEIGHQICEAEEGVRLCVPPPRAVQITARLRMTVSQDHDVERTL